jgi:hypothetical protein
MRFSRLAAFSVMLAAFSASAFAQSENEIEYRERVTLNVGESVVIHGIRGDCGQLPTRGDIELPALTTGTLSVGKEGYRESRRCNGETPAVEVIFTATAPGRERFEIEGDPISVRVRN